MMRSVRFLFATIGVFVASEASADPNPDVRYEPHPPDVLAVGLVASGVFGSAPAIGIGVQADYLSFDNEIRTEIGRNARARGAYGRVQIYIPFDRTHIHMHYAIGIVSLLGGERRSDENKGGATIHSYFYGARFGIAYRASASELRQTWGPEVEPFIGSSNREGTWFWMGARFAPPLSDVVMPGGRSHGWELGPNVGMMAPIAVSGTHPGTSD